MPKAWSYFAVLLKGSGLDQGEERRRRMSEKTMDPDKLNRFVVTRVCLHLLLRIPYVMGSWYNLKTCPFLSGYHLVITQLRLQTFSFLLPLLLSCNKNYHII